MVLNNNNNNKHHSFVSLMMAEQGRNMLLNYSVVNLQLLFVCFLNTVQFNKFVTCTQRNGNKPIP